MRTAVIIATYNRPDALAAVLAGYAAQDTQDFELLIADDGSRDDIRLLVEDYAKHVSFPVQHVWQEDDGYRAAAARNRALAHTDAEYVIYTDGDCVPPTFFVSRHRALAQTGWFLSGNRLLLSEGCTQAVLEQHLPIHGWSRAQWLAARLARDVNRVLPLLHLPDGAWRHRSATRWQGVMTCNFSAWRADLARVNGFDESYSGWGLEDSDLVIRLLHAGVRHKSARFAIPIFHLWHRENDRSGLAANQIKLAQLMASDRVRAQIGLDRYA